jgi:sec-independent protein translocase protein TatC
MANSLEREMPFLDHLEELRHRLFWVVGAVGIGLVAGFAVSFGVPQVMDFVTSPITALLKPQPNGLPGMLVTTTPMGAFKFRMTLALYLAVVLALPVILYQVWAFLSPGLYKNERKVMIPVLGAGTLLFMLGVTTAFKLALPVSLSFLLRIAEQNLQPMITIEAYFDLLLTMCLAFGIMFELPMVVLALTWLGVVTPQLLSRTRPYAVVILLVACALVTPPELMSLAIMFIPVYLLYEISVLLAWVMTRRRERASAAIDDAEAKA